MEPEIKKYALEIKKKIKIGKDPRLLVHAISYFQKSTDLITNRVVAANGVSFDCKKGCHHCCSLRVEVLPPEALLIAKHIKSLATDKKEILIRKLKEHSLYAKGKTFTEYNKPCAFLSESGECEIYSVRPHKCRSNLSKSVNSCISTRDAEEDQHVKWLHNALSSETVSIYKSKGCIMHPTELTQGVLSAIEDETLASKWANGNQAYELLPERIML